MEVMTSLIAASDSYHVVMWMTTNVYKLLILIHVIFVVLCAALDTVLPIHVQVSFAVILQSEQ